MTYMEFEEQKQPPRQCGPTPLGLQKLRDAADPSKPHAYEWYVIGSINTPEEHMERTSALETAIRAYAALDCEDKRLGVTKDGIAAVDLIIRRDGHEWISEDRLKLDSFKSDPVVAAAVAKLQKATGAAMRLTLTLLGRDSWSRPVYEGSDGSLYVDTDPRADRQPRISPSTATPSTASRTRPSVRTSPSSLTGIPGEGRPVLSGIRGERRLPMRRLTKQDIENIIGSTIEGHRVEAARIKDGPYTDSEHYFPFELSIL